MFLKVALEGEVTHWTLSSLALTRPLIKRKPKPFAVRFGPFYFCFGPFYFRYLLPCRFLDHTALPLWQPSHLSSEGRCNLHHHPTVPLSIKFWRNFRKIINNVYAYCVMAPTPHCLLHSARRLSCFPTWMAHLGSGRCGPLAPCSPPQSLWLQLLSNSRWRAGPESLFTLPVQARYSPLSRKGGTGAD